jgi:UPF0271 protein
MNIDLNSDLGEGFGLWKMGDDEELMKLVSSANIACGGHAGDHTTMHNAIASATKENVVIGAHPGFEDRQGFGRRRIALTTAEISQKIACADVAQAIPRKMPNSWQKLAPFPVAEFCNASC